MTYPELIPHNRMPPAATTLKGRSEYTPRVFGFRIHRESAYYDAHIAEVEVAEQREAARRRHERMKRHKEHVRAQQQRQQAAEHGGARRGGGGRRGRGEGAAAGAPPLEW